MKRIMLSIAGLSILGSFAVAQTELSQKPRYDLPEMTMYKDQYCGCCTSYADYLKEHGVKVNTINHPNMSKLKDEQGTANGASCHTIVMDHYVVEGHVPIDSIQKLWDEQPDIKGVALPGMPQSSPGMGDPIKGSLKIMAIEHSSAVNTLFNQE